MGVRGDPAFSRTPYAKAFIRERKLSNQRDHTNIKLLLAAISIVLLYYISVLYKIQGVYYAPAPYHDFRFSILNTSAYIPFLLLALIIPLMRINVHVFRDSCWGFFSKGLFAVNNLFYLILIALFPIGDCIAYLIENSCFSEQRISLTNSPGQLSLY